MDFSVLSKAKVSIGNACATCQLTRQTYDKPDHIMCQLNRELLAQRTRAAINGDGNYSMVPSVEARRRKLSKKRPVIGPGCPEPITRASISTIGTISAAVPVKNTSSATQTS